MFLWIGAISGVKLICRTFHLSLPMVQLLRVPPELMWLLMVIAVQMKTPAPALTASVVQLKVGLCFLKRKNLRQRQLLAIQVLLAILVLPIVRLIPESFSLS